MFLQQTIWRLKLLFITTNVERMLDLLGTKIQYILIIMDMRIQYLIEYGTTCIYLVIDLI